MFCRLLETKPLKIGLVKHLMKVAEIDETELQTVFICNDWYGTSRSLARTLRLSSNIIERHTEGGGNCGVNID